MKRVKKLRQRIRMTVVFAQQKQAAGFENARKLGQHKTRVSDVVQHLQRKHAIKRGVGKWQCFARLDECELKISRMHRKRANVAGVHLADAA